MMLALATAVTLRRPLATAYSNAYRTIRRVASAVIGLMEIAAWGGILPPAMAAIDCACGLSTSNSTPA